MRVCHLAAAAAIASLVLSPGATAQSAASPATAVPTPATPPAPIAARAFYGPAGIGGVALSRSGRWLALKAPLNGRAGLVVFDLQEWRPLASAAASFADADIDDFHWVGDERLVFDVEDRQLGGGGQRWWPGLFAVDRDGKNARTLVKLEQPFVSSQRYVGREPLAPWHTLLGVPEDDSGDVIVAEYQWDGAREFKGLVPKRLNVNTGRATSLSHGAPGNAWRWIFDARGEPRLVETRGGGRTTYHWREGTGTQWKPIAEFASLAPPFVPRFVGADGDLYVAAHDRSTDTRVLRRFDFATGRPRDEALVRSPGFDFEGRIVSETPGSRALGVRVVTDAETTVWFDPVMAALQKAADARLPGHINRIVCRRCGERDMVAVVFAFNDRDPGQYWYHEAASGTWKKIGDTRPGIEPRRMGSTDFERIRARDGLEIPLWITRPAQAAPAADAAGAATPRQAPAPAVVLVHGGPWVRGRHWRWEADAQFLASRGYVVLQPEFRGSTGYGSRLHRAGLRQWGQAMQNDLIDALDWAVKQGLVDPDRVCIAGASYGGYATLMGLVRHGERFRCGAAWVGVSDPRLLFEWRYDYDMHTEYREHSLPQLIGDPAKDAEMLDANTPLLHAARIDKPLLLAYGGADRRVPLVHGERMKKALEAAGRPPEWVLYPDEGHGWFKLETRLDFAARLEAFLARHLGPAGTNGR